MGNPLSMKSIRAGNAFLYHADAMSLYEHWPAPRCIIADGPYGLGKFPEEPKTPTDLAEWYAPHVAEWAKRASTDCTLWFWNTELGWATVHPVLEQHGWQYEELCVWDKGIAHIAGNVNSKTIRGIPVVTEVAVRYTKKNRLCLPSGERVTLKEWVRAEWLRSGLPLYKSNEACGVANAATRKYLTQCHLWYFPPAEAISKMAAFCSKHGLPDKGWPYFSLDGKNAFDSSKWTRMRSYWVHKHGLTNVWQAPPVHGGERLKIGNAYLHANQKPLSLMDIQIQSCTDEGDVVWEPFGGLCSGSVSATRLGRRSYAAELFDDYFKAASLRLKNETSKNRVAA